MQRHFVHVLPILDIAIRGHTIQFDFFFYSEAFLTEVYSTNSRFRLPTFVNVKLWTNGTT